MDGDDVIFGTGEKLVREMGEEKGFTRGGRGGKKDREPKGEVSGD